MRCEECGYVLHETGDPAALCPECGAEVSLSGVESRPGTPLQCRHSPAAFVHALVLMSCRPRYYFRRAIIRTRWCRSLLVLVALASMIMFLIPGIIIIIGGPMHLSDIAPSGVRSIRIVNPISWFSSGIGTMIICVIGLWTNKLEWKVRQTETHQEASALLAANAAMVYLPFSFLAMIMFGVRRWVLPPQGPTSSGLDELMFLLGASPVFIFILATACYCWIIVGGLKALRYCNPPDPSMNVASTH